MRQQLTRCAAVMAAAVLSACNATGDERTYDTTRPAPATPTPTVAPDSTTGVARSSGRPGVAGDTVARSSKISAPKTKAP